MAPLPTISVAMINHNYGEYVGAAVESVLDQTHPALQVVVVDDGSTDGSREVLRAFGGRIQLICTPNRGKGAATNDAVAACRGDVVALIDSDDLMLPERLHRLVDTYAANPGAQWVWHQMRHVDRLTLAPVETPSPPGFSAGPHDHRAAVARGRLPLSTPATSALSWRNSFLSTLLPMRSTMRSQDNYLKFLTIGLAPGHVIGEVLALQGLHATNAYTTAVGPARRRKQAVRALDLAPGLRAWGLSSLHLRTVSEVVVNTSGGLTLDPADRALLHEEVRVSGLRLVPWLAVAAARRTSVGLREFSSERDRGSVPMGSEPR